MRSNYRTLAVWAIVLGSLFLLVSPPPSAPIRGVRSASPACRPSTSSTRRGLVGGSRYENDWRLELDQGRDVLVATGPLCVSSSTR